MTQLDNEYIKKFTALFEHTKDGFEVNSKKSEEFQFQLSVTETTLRLVEPRSLSSYVSIYKLKEHALTINSKLDDGLNRVKFWIKIKKIGNLILNNKCTIQNL